MKRRTKAKELGARCPGRINIRLSLVALLVEPFSAVYDKNGWAIYFLSARARAARAKTKSTSPPTILSWWIWEILHKHPALLVRYPGGLESI
jgi:hypothetical protein